MPGSIPITLPPPTVDYPVDMMWPAPYDTAAVDAAAFNVNAMPKYQMTPVSFWSAVSGASTNNMGGNPYGGQFTCGAAAVSSRSTAPIGYIPLTQFAPATYQSPEPYRVFRFQFVIFAPAMVNFTTLSGFVLEPAAAVAPGWLDAGNRGFGLVGDGAGHWQYVEKNAGGVGVYQFTQAVTWPTAFTNPVLVDYEILGATGASPAVFTLYLNGLQILTRTWGGGSSLPDYSSPAGARKFVFAISAGDAALAGQINIANVRLMNGRYRVSGAQI